MEKEYVSCDQRQESFTMELKEFEDLVIKESHKVPVLVDFWAPWCGPCQFIAPVLEELYNEANGRWKLIKVNVDESQELTARYGVRGIPNIKLFHKGEVLSEQSGALPKFQMEKWLEEQIPDPRQEKLEAILHDIDSGQESAIDKLSSFVDENDDFMEGKVALAERLVFTEVSKVKSLLEDIGSHIKYLERLDWVKSIAELQTAPLEDDGAMAATLAQARSSLESNDLEAGIQALIKAVKIDKSFQNDLPRRSAIAIFNMLGPGHEITKKYRKNFDMALY